MKPITVQIFGGRDVGKTTIAMHSAVELRWLGIPTSLTYGINKFWGDPVPIVSMRIYDVNPHTLAPHAIAEFCAGCMNFLVRRRTDYEFVSQAGFRELSMADDKLEKTMRDGHVRYKTLPGVRASVLYVIKKVCDAVGYDR